MKLRRGDKVLIIAGRERGKTGVIERVWPKQNKILITGINRVKKHLKKSPKNPQGGIIEKELPLQASNAMLLDPKTSKPTRLGIKLEGNKKLRLSRQSGEVIESK